MKIKPAIDVVVVTAGRLDMLEKCLEHIVSTVDVPISLTVIDNGVEKDKRKLNEKLFKKPEHTNIVEFYTKRIEINVGYGKSNNEGARFGNAPIITFISDDIFVKPGYFSRIVEKMNSHPEIGILGAKLLFPDDSVDQSRPGGKVQHVGVSLDISANAVHPLVGWSADHPKTCITREVFAVTGATFSIRRNYWKQVGGFDPVYGKGYWEDIDLCLKVRQLGGKIIMDCELLACHYTGASHEIDKTFSSDFQHNANTFRARWSAAGMLVADSWTYG